jgi:hypothetical protein
VSCGNLSFALLISTSSAEAARFTHSEATITVRFVDDDGQPRRIPWLTATRVSADPQGVFPPSSIQVVIYDDRTLVTIRPLLTPANSAAYFANPYGIRLNLETTAGIRTIQIGPVQQLTPQDIQRLQSDALRKLNDCLAKQRDIGKRGGRFDLEWLIDPAPYERETYRLWHVGVLRLTPGDRVVGEDMDGNRLGEAVADEHGIARLSVMTGDGPAHRLLVLHRQAGRDLGHDADIRVKQITLVPQGTIPLSGELRSIETRTVGGRQLAAIQTSRSVALLDLTVPGAPRAHFQMEARESDAFAVTDDGLALLRGGEATTWSYGNAPRRTDPEQVRRTPTGPVRRVHAAHAMRHTEPMRQRQDALRAQSMRVETTDRTSLEQPGALVEYYTIGNTVLVPAADGRSLQLFTAGRRVEG